MIYSCVLHSLIYICLHSSSEAVQELSRDAVTVDESPCEEEGSKDVTPWTATLRTAGPFLRTIKDWDCSIAKIR